MLTTLYKMSLLRKIVAKLIPAPESASPCSDKDDARYRWYQGMQAFDRGKVAMAENDLERAVKLFDEAVSLGFESEDLYGSRGTCLEWLEWPLDAIDDFTQAIRLNPDNANNFFQRANVKHSVGDAEGAVKDSDEAIRLAKIPSPLHQLYDAKAREDGFESVAHCYEASHFILRGGDSHLMRRRCEARKAKAEERGRRVKG